MALVDAIIFYSVEKMGSYLNGTQIISNHDIDTTEKTADTIDKGT